MPPKFVKRPKLPQSLRRELEDLGHIQPLTKRKGGGVVGRKERRKLERQGKKEKNEEFFQVKSKSKSHLGKSLGDRKNDNGKRARVVEDEEEVPAKKKRVSTTDPSFRIPKVGGAKKETALEKLVNKVEGKGKGRKGKDVTLKLDNEDDEDMKIAWLEKQLGQEMEGEMEEDGLNDLMKDIDNLEGILDDLGASGDEGDDSLNEDKREIDAIDSHDEDGHNLSNLDLSDMEDNDFFAYSTEDEFEGDIDLGETGDEVSLDEEEGDEDEDEEQRKKELEHNTKQNASTTIVPSSKNESISTVSTTGRYVPPHLREKSSTTSTATTKQPSTAVSQQRRPLLGLLNRLTPTSLLSLLPLFQSFFSTISRGELTPLLSSVIIEDILCTPDSLGNGITLSLAGLVAWRARERATGKAEVAGIAAATVERLDKVMKSEGGGKQKDNLLEFVANLVNFKVLSPEIIFGLVREAAERCGNGGMREEDVELVLRAVKACGQQLKAEDPASIKEISDLVALKVKSADPSSVSSRTRFMLETLEKLKSTKSQFKKGGLIEGSDAYNAVRLFLNGLDKKRPNDVPVPLRVNLESVRNAVKKGLGAKWWLTGAGHLMETNFDPWNVGDGLERKEGVKQGKEQGKGGERVELKTLAKKQGMNTDVRERIFGVIMTSEDYMDACEKLLQLKLTETQQREIVRVVLQCSGSEKSYNPYYTLIGHRILTRSSTKQSHSYQVTMQYWLWDFFRELGEEDVGGMSEGIERTRSGVKVEERRRKNVATCYGWWIAKAGLSLGILKPLSFATLTPDSKAFLSNLLTSMFLSLQTASPLLNFTTTSSLKKEDSVLEKILYKSPVVGDKKLVKGLCKFLDASYRPEEEVQGRRTKGEGAKAREVEILEWSVERMIDLLDR